MFELLFLICLPFDYSQCGWNFEYAPPEGDRVAQYTIDFQNKQITISENLFECVNACFARQNTTIWAKIMNTIETNLPLYDGEGMRQQVGYWDKCPS